MYSIIVHGGVGAVPQLARGRRRLSSLGSGRLFLLEVTFLQTVDPRWTQWRLL
jgi:hypothetical protein